MPRLHAALSQIRETDHTIKAWETIDEKNALRRAATLPATSRYKAASKLRGLIVGIKDVIDVAGMPTKAGSAARAKAKLADADATVVKRLNEAGAIILGKTKTTEFAYTDPTDTANPANPRHTPGGSSSGSAAAVAAGMADLALGTQTVGSVCRPAAYCGVAAFKPSTGSTPCHGVVPLARTFDTVGFLARDMRLAVEAFACCAGGAPLEFKTVSISWPALRIGLVADPFYLDCAPDIAAALETGRHTLERLGATVIDIKAHVDYEAMREQHRVMMFREAALAHGHLLEQPELLGPNWRAALERGAALLESDYWEARDNLAEAKVRLAAACAQVDVLLLPPTRTTAPEGLHSTGDAGFILPWTVVGGPLAVLPVGTTRNGLPTAVMIAGKPWTDLATGLLAASLQAELGHQ
ncbi:MAG: amidase [Pseudorhodoplanes sp.]|nr:amidase [Pseudorhodoplanes sp.]